MSSSNFFDVVVFLLLGLVTGLSFMSISLLILELWQFVLKEIRPEIQKQEVPSSEFYQFCPMPNLIPNLAWKSLLESYLMLKNTLPSPPTPHPPPTPPATQIRVKIYLEKLDFEKILILLQQGNLSYQYWHQSTSSPPWKQITPPTWVTPSMQNLLHVLSPTCEQFLKIVQLPPHPHPHSWILVGVHTMTIFIKKE